MATSVAVGTDCRPRAIARSAEVTFVSGTEVEFTHGLGTNPQMVDVVLTSIALDNSGTDATSKISWVEGTHTSLLAKVTLTTVGDYGTIKGRVYAYY